VKRALVALAALALSAAPASAGWAIFGSGWDPNAIEDALGGGMSFTVPLGDEGLGLDFRGSFFQQADFDNIGDDEQDVIREFGLQVMPVDAAVRWDFNRRGAANFYLGGGVSYLFLELDEGPDLDDEIGWLGFAGVQFGDPHGARFFIEGGYRGVESTVRADDLHDFFDDDDGEHGGDEIDEDVAIDLDGVTINVGVAWSF
jgi:hypothetical protein